MGSQEGLPENVMWESEAWRKSGGADNGVGGQTCFQTRTSLLRSLWKPRRLMRSSREEVGEDDARTVEPAWEGGRQAGKDVKASRAEERKHSA